MHTELMSGWTTMRRHEQQSTSLASRLCLWGGVLLMGAAGIALGCEQAEAGEGARAAQPAAEPQVPAPAKAATSKVNEANFAIEVKAGGPYKAKQPGEVTIELVAKGPYKVNDKYPYKFKLKESEGVSFPADVVRKDKVKLEQKKAVMPVAFTPESPGEKRIAGQFAFSVCTDERCVIEKRDLAVKVAVK